MLNKNKGSLKKADDTGVFLILDKSGSMATRRSETIQEFNKYLGKLREDGFNYYLTVTLFDTETEALVKNTHISDVGELDETEYNPSGWTALHDAVVKTLRGAKERSKNICVVITDGEENSSRRFDLEDVRREIEHKKNNHDWEFVYLGNGPDSWHIGKSMGFRWNIATDWASPTATSSAYGNVLTVTSGTAGGTGFTANMLNTRDTKAEKNDD